MVVGLGVIAAETVGTGEGRERRGEEAEGGARQKARTQHQKKWNGDVVEIVDDVVEQGAVEKREALAHFDEAGERAVGGINHDSDGHHEESAAKIIGGDAIKGEQSGDGAGSSKEMDAPGGDGQIALASHRSATRVRGTAYDRASRNDPRARS